MGQYCFERKVHLSITNLLLLWFVVGIKCEQHITTMFYAVESNESGCQSRRAHFDVEHGQLKMVTMFMLHFKIYKKLLSHEA